MTISAVVAELPERSEYPYSSLALSPDRTQAVAGCLDTLHILPLPGLGSKQTVPFTKTGWNESNRVVTAVAWSAGKIAAAASNGSIAVYREDRLGTPEAWLDKHVQTVNRLAWHSTIPGLLLSASQDGTVALWERKPMQPAAQGKSWFKPAAPTSFSWEVRVFDPKSQAVVDAQWSPHYPNGTKSATQACI